MTATILYRAGLADGTGRPPMRDAAIRIEEGRVKAVGSSQPGRALAILTGERPTGRQEQEMPSSADPGKPSAHEAGKTVDDYVASLEGWRRETATALRELARAAAPEARESIKWGQPVYELNGPFAWMKAHKATVNFGFWRGAELSDPQGLLDGEGDRMRHLKVREGAALPTEELRRLIAEAVRLNAEKGDPARRR